MGLRGGAAVDSLHISENRQTLRSRRTNGVEILRLKILIRCFLTLSYLAQEQLSRRVRP